MSPRIDVIHAFVAAGHLPEAGISIWSRAIARLTKNWRARSFARHRPIALNVAAHVVSVGRQTAILRSWRTETMRRNKYNARKTTVVT